MDRPRKSKLWLKRLGLAAGALALVVILFFTAERVRGQYALQKRLAELRFHGEVLKVAAFKPSLVLPENNAFLVLSTLTNHHEAFLTNIWKGPPLLEFAQPGVAQVAWQIEHWNIDENTTNTWIQFSATLDEAKALFTLARTAASKPQYSTALDYDKGFENLQVGPIVTAKQGVQLLSFAMIDDLRNHRIASAHSNLCASIRLAVMQEPEPLLIYQLVRIACGAIAFNATWQALQAPNWNDEQLAALQVCWEQARFPEDMARAMEMERAMTLDQFEKLRRSSVVLHSELEKREKVGEFLPDQNDGLPTHGFVLNHLHAPIWRYAWLAQDELRALNLWQTIIERERFARSNSWAALSGGHSPNESLYIGFLADGEGQKLNLYDRLRYLVSNEPFSINDLLIRKELQMQTLQHMAITAIAIQRFRLMTGKLPGSLTDLVPHYLSGLLSDPVDGKTLRYRTVSKGKFHLYSVGTDGNDDAGDPSPVDDKKPIRQIWDGKDAVWPIPSGN